MLFPFPASRASQSTMGQFDQNFLVAKYGDGYEQRMAIGMNSKHDKWEVQVNNLSFEQYETMMAFWNAHGRVIAFEWVPPNGTVANKYVFDSPLSLTNTGDRYSFSMTLARRFE